MKRMWIGALTALGVAFASGEALACGGCFSPPTIPQVVTEHRMALAVSSQQTTLWDQFRFSGRPEEFSWILPIRYSDAVQIAVGSDAFLQALAVTSTPTLTPPPAPWPPCPYNPPPVCALPTTAGGNPDAADASVFDDAFPTPDAPAPPVQVLREEAVGPFEVRVIRGDDPMALRLWLVEHGYAVPAALEPVLGHYTSLSMDFLALRLRPEQGIDRIAPVRVTFPGNVPRLPLRMIAAGVGDRVGLRLFVLAEGRMEAANFPNDQYVDDDFVYDWSAPAWSQPGGIGALFDAAFTRRRDAMGARLWLTESSDGVSRDALAAQTAPWEQSPRGAGDSGAMTARPSDDLRVAFEHLGASARLTRLRADFPGAMLDRDLELSASDRGRRARAFAFGRQRNIPPPPTCPDGSRYDPAQRRFVGAQPWAPCPRRQPEESTRSVSIARASCGAGPSPRGPLGWALALALFGVARRARRARGTPP